MGADSRRWQEVSRRFETDPLPRNNESHKGLKRQQEVAGCYYLLTCARAHARMCMCIVIPPDPQQPPVYVCSPSLPDYLTAGYGGGRLGDIGSRPPADLLRPPAISDSGVAP